MVIDANSMRPLKKPTKDKNYYIKLYALSQYHFDEVGIGWERTLEIKREICGYDDLYSVSLYKLEKLIKALRKEFKKLQVDSNGGLSPSSAPSTNKQEKK